MILSSTNDLFDFTPPIESVPGAQSDSDLPTFTLRPLASSEIAAVMSSLQRNKDTPFMDMIDLVRLSLRAVEGVQNGDGSPVKVTFERGSVFGLKTSEIAAKSFLDRLPMPVIDAIAGRVMETFQGLDPKAGER